MANAAGADRMWNITGRENKAQKEDSVMCYVYLPPADWSVRAQVRGCAKGNSSLITLCSRLSLVFARLERIPRREGGGRAP